MKLIKKMSYKCARQVTSSLNDTHCKKSVYYYGFQIVIGAMAKGILLLAVSLMLNVLRPTMVCTMIFVFLRIFAGGCHMDTYFKCILTSLVQFVSAGMIAGYTYKCWSIEYVMLLVILTFVAGFYTIVRYAPKDSINKPIQNQRQRKRFKMMSIKVLFVWFAVAFVLAVINKHMYVIAASFGILLEVFSISPAGHKFYCGKKAGMSDKQ